MSSASRYGLLSKAKVAYAYLETNATTHQYAFCAMAELCDNARDAGAKSLRIYTIKNEKTSGGFMLSFLDDGDGMSPKEASDVMSFGTSAKKALDMNLIGQYGNGLKSGTMSLGRDFILFTKKNSIYTIIFVSRTFHEEEKIVDEIVYLIPSFDAAGQPYIHAGTTMQKHKMEIDLILKYSPYRTKEELFNEFAHIHGEHGALVTVYNLRVKEHNGFVKPELDIVSNQNDIRIPNEDNDLPIERSSFRAYMSILYSDPYMKIYIQGSKVRTKRLEYTLYEPRCYRYLAKSVFKKKAEQDLEKAKNAQLQVENRLNEAESFLIRQTQVYRENSDKHSKKALNEYQEKVNLLRNELSEKKVIYEQKKKNLNEPKQLTFKFGINLQNKSQDGLFIYNCNRLIVMSEKPKSIQNNPEYDGIVGVVDVPYEVLEPSHNKQQFSDAKEHQKLSKTLIEYMQHYVEKMKQELRVDSMRELWKQYGYYVGSNIPSDEFVFKKKRFFKVNLLLQCDECLKWRQLPSNTSDIDKVFPDKWCCENMTNSSEGNKCSDYEKLKDIPFLTYTKEPIKVKTNNTENNMSWLNSISKPTNSQLARSSSTITVSKSVPQPLKQNDFYKHLNDLNKKQKVTQLVKNEQSVASEAVHEEPSTTQEDLCSETSSYIDTIANEVYENVNTKAQKQSKPQQQRKRFHSLEDDDDDYVYKQPKASKLTNPNPKPIPAKPRNGARIIGLESSDSEDEGRLNLLKGARKPVQSSVEIEQVTDNGPTTSSTAVQTQSSYDEIISQIEDLKQKLDHSNKMVERLNHNLKLFANLTNIDDTLDFTSMSADDLYNFNFEEYIANLEKQANEVDASVDVIAQ